VDIRAVFNGTRTSWKTYLIVVINHSDDEYILIAYDVRRRLESAAFLSSFLALWVAFVRVSSYRYGTRYIRILVPYIESSAGLVVCTVFSLTGKG
jgi:hypothetical protein